MKTKVFRFLQVAISISLAQTLQESKSGQKEALQNIALVKQPLTNKKHKWQLNLKKKTV